MFFVSLGTWLTMFCHGLLPPPPPMTMICHVFCIPRYMVDHVLSWIAAPPPPMTMICHVFCIPRYMVDHVIPWFILWKQNTVDHVIPCYTMLYHVIPCYTMLYHVNVKPENMVDHVLSWIARVYVGHFGGFN